MAPTLAPDYTLAGRYRIQELLGVGRTAEVYTAEDLSLQRRVVVKVLLADLAAHEEIRRAFRERIIRASKLSHPHLARVFDGGQEHGSIFMISEYLSGGSLEDVLRAGRRLSVDEGARLGRDVASALAYVHEQGFVLGTLSPSKLLFDNDGRVRVSDVALSGLASGYRELMSLDDARYLSPEQAIGEPAGPESDVYALALILFEAVTGSAAYEGTTPEAILRARLTTPLPVRLELGTLDMVLAQAALPDPRLRLDAEQFSTRLGGLIGDDAPLVLGRSPHETPLLSQFERPEPRSSIGFRPPSAEQIVSSPEGLATGSFPRVSRISTSEPAPGIASPPRGPITPLGRTPRFDRGQYDLPRAPRRRTGFLIAAVVLVLLAIGAGAAWKAGVFSKSHTVPTLTGLTLSQATTAVKPDGFTLNVTDVKSSSVPKSHIVAQSPTAGSSLKSGSTINIELSLGPKIVTLPTNLDQRTCAGATSALKALHVTATCPTADEVFSSTVPVGDVATVLYHKTPNPLAVPTGSSVILELSKGPSVATTTAPATPTTTTTLAGQGLRAVPNVVGDDYAEANAAFKKAVLYFTTTGTDAGTTTWTDVISESPTAGTMVPYKSSVTLTVK
jgi:beta-lactam-binding protein with PASTA domain/tRNA A-37 threonylcarbamoyl transferase component Bud32